MVPELPRNFSHSNDLRNWIPRQRQRHHGRIDLIVDLLRHVGLNSRLIDTVLVAPVQDLFLRQVRIWRELTTRRSERAGAVASAAVLILSAVASPIGGDYDIRFRAFGGLNEKAFDDPEDGHKLAGFEGLDAGGEFFNRSNEQRDYLGVAKTKLVWLR